MQINLNQLSSYQQQVLPPIMMVFGDEPQQKMQFINQVRLLAKQQGYAERLNFTADKEFSWDQLVESANAMSLFSDKQIIEVHLPTGKPGTEGAKTLIQIAEMANPDVCIVLHGPRIGKDVQRTKWFKTCDQIGIHCMIYPLTGQAYHRWLKQLVQAKGMLIDDIALNVLAESCEGNMLAAEQEVEKLAILHEGQQLTTEMLKAALVDQSRFTIFQLLDLMLGGQTQQAIKTLYRLESEGLDANAILWHLTKEWERIANVYNLQQQGERIPWPQLGIWGARQNLYTQTCQRLDETMLQTLAERLAQLDLALKSSAHDKPFLLLANIIIGFALPATGQAKHSPPLPI